MKSLIRVSSIFIVLSIAFASESKEEMVDEVQVNNTEAPDKQLLQSDVAPIDIDQIKKIRFVNLRICVANGSRCRNLGQNTSAESHPA